MSVTRATEPCQRCGGVGGWKGWPGFTCYRCGGSGQQRVQPVRQPRPSTHGATATAEPTPPVPVWPSRFAFTAAGLARQEIECTRCYAENTPRRCTMISYADSTRLAACGYWRRERDDRRLPFDGGAS